MRPKWRDDALRELVRYVGGRVRSRQEILATLRRRGLSVAQATRVVRAAQARGILDERAGASLWADHWARAGYAWSAIRLKLLARGFREAAINDAERRLSAEEHDDARAHRVLESLLQRAHGPAASRRPRLVRTLSSRGFDSDLIDQLLNDTLGPDSSDAEP